MLSDLNSGKHHNKWSLPGPSCKPHSWKGKRNEFQPPMSAMGSFAIGPSQQETLQRMRRSRHDPRAMYCHVPAAAVSS